MESRDGQQKKIGVFFIKEKRNARDRFLNVCRILQIDQNTMHSWSRILSIAYVMCYFDLKTIILYTDRDQERESTFFACAQAISIWRK